MPRAKLSKHRPSTTRQTWCKDAMIEAIKKVRSKEMSLHGASRTYKVPRTTLSRLASEVNSPEDAVIRKVGRKPALPNEIEEELVENLIKMESQLRRKDVQKLAYQLAEKNKVKHPFRNEAAGRAWFDHFLRRHGSKISIKTPKVSTDEFVSLKAIIPFFDSLDSLYAKHNFPPDRIFNADVSGLKVESEVTEVVCIKGKHKFEALTSAERSSLVTVVCCMSAGGNFLPPMMIFPIKNMSEELMNGAPPCSIGRAYPGWIPTELFIEWLDHFIKKTNPTEDSPVLLVLDGQYSHTKNPNFMKMAEENHVIILSIPPYTSNKLQPLETFMRPLKTRYSENIRHHLLREKQITLNDIADLFGRAYLKATSGFVAVEGFKAAGIYPLNRNIFSGELLKMNCESDDGLIQSDEENSSSNQSLPLQEHYLAPLLPQFPSLIE